MNASQLIAWLICLGLAFFASVLAVRNSYEMALLERDFAEVRSSADDHSAVLADMHKVLGQIERLLAGRAPDTTAGETNGIGAAIEELRRRIQAMEERVGSPQPTQ